MKKTPFLILFLLISQIIFAQKTTQIKGLVKSSDGNLLSNATITIFFKANKDSIKTLSDEKGNFVFNAIKNERIKLISTYIGFDNFVKYIDLLSKDTQQITEEIIMIPGDNMLGNVTLESQKIQIKEDTVSYKVDSTMYRKNDNVESILKNLPGVQVDKDGTVTAQGKQVTKVKVNGKEFFNGDVTTATRELNADMVDRIQIIDDYGDQAAFTGIKDGDPSKTMNIQLKKDKNKGYFGNQTVGAGTDGRYIGSVSLNRFNNNQQISLLSNLNNTNFNQFNFGSMGGAMGNMMGGMARSMGIGRGGGGVGAAIGNLGNNDGINTTKSIGMNYRDNWGSKIEVYGSYSFSNKQTNTIKNSTQENVFLNQSNSYIQNSNNQNIVNNNRASFNIEYKIDSANYIKLNPSFSHNKTNAQYNSVFLSEIDSRKISNGNMDDNSISNSPNFSGSLLYNHRFQKRGRTISFNFNTGGSATKSDEDYDNLTTRYVGINAQDTEQVLNILQNNNNRNYGARISYTEPLTKKRNVEINYSHNNQYVDNNRSYNLFDSSTNTYNFIDSLSNVYSNRYSTNRIGINLRTTEKKYNYTIGFSALPATIETKSVTGDTSYTNHIVNYFPIIRLAYNFSKSRSFNINYNGNSSQPSNSQLQPVADNSNPQYITIGNPALKPEFTSTMSMRYNNFDYISGNVFFGNISASFVQDKIVNNTKLFASGVQETRYQNTDGYYTLFGFYNISRPIQNRKYVFNLGGNVGYNNNVSFIRDLNDNSSKNIGRNWTIGQRFSTDIKIKKWLETTISANYNLNSSNYSLQPNLNSKTIAWTLSNNSRIFFREDFIFSYDIEKTLNDGLSANVNTNPLIINAILEKQFLSKRNLSLKLQAFDLMNENIGLNRSVSATGFTDTRTNRLGRYFMISIVYRLNKFFGDQQKGGGNMMMGMPPMGEEIRIMRGAN
jgi:hypothetical protein